MATFRQEWNAAVAEMSRFNGFFHLKGMMIYINIHFYLLVSSSHY